MIHDDGIDLTSPLVGRRCWGLYRTDKDDPTAVLLCSNADTVWPAREELSAVCPSGQHDPPGEGCSCGVYAHFDGDDWGYYAYDGVRYPVFGEVNLWGTVLASPGSRVYRAEFAYPKAIYLAHKDHRFARPLEQAYGVPVLLRNPFKKEK